MHRKFTLGVLLVANLQNLFAQNRSIAIIDEQRRIPVTLTIVVQDSKGNTKQEIPTTAGGWIRPLSCCKPNDLILVKSDIFARNPIFFCQIKDTLYVHTIKYAQDGFLDKLNATRLPSTYRYHPNVPSKKSRRIPSNAHVSSTLRHSVHTQMKAGDIHAKVRLVALVDSYKGFFRQINAGTSFNNPSSFTRLFSGSYVPLPNDFFANGTPSFGNPEEYFFDITAFFLDNLPVHVIDLHTADRSFFAREGDKLYTWVFKSFQYSYDSLKFNVSGWCRLTIIWMGEKNGYRIMGIEKADDPVDSDGDGIPDSYDRCPLTIPGTNTDMYGCKVNYRHRKINQ